MQKVCGLLGDLKSECDDLIDYYWDDVWEMVVKEVVSTRPVHISSNNSLTLHRLLFNVFRALCKNYNSELGLALKIGSSPK